LDVYFSYISDISFFAAESFFSKNL